MKMKIIALAIFSVFISACVGMSYPVAHDKDFPPDGRYEILGDIVVENATIIIFGMFWSGGVTYEDLRNAARQRFNLWGTLFDVVNVTVDREIISIMGVYTRINTVVRGTAIMYFDFVRPAPTE